MGERFPALDGLRGVAVLMVMFHHLGFSLTIGPNALLRFLYWPLAAGGSGVDLFFVLSGFLITGILTKFSESENYFSTFYAHRALRIFPLLFILLAVVTLIMVPAGLAFAGDAKIWPYWLFLANMRLLGVKLIQFIGVTWTLAIEEQFYVVWSIVIRYVRREHLMAVAVSTLAFGVLLRSSLLHLVTGAGTGTGATDGIHSFTLTHLDGLCIGAILRLAYDEPRWHHTLKTFARTTWIWGLIYIAGCAADVRFGSYDQQWNLDFNLHFGLTLLSLLFAGILISGLMFDSLTRRILDIPWLRRMGLYSYFMYLYHFLIAWPFDVVAQRIGIGSEGWGGVVLLVVKFGAIICAGHLSYVRFERPILEFKKQLKYKEGLIGQPVAV
jgi:peptidoglycan/LPS O-acetylase OafA/YrhL